MQGINVSREKCLACWEAGRFSERRWTGVGMFLVLVSYLTYVTLSNATRNLFSLIAPISIQSYGFFSP